MNKPVVGARIVAVAGRIVAGVRTAVIMMMFT
jgi:hypothetical protein